MRLKRPQIVCFSEHKYIWNAKSTNRLMYTVVCISIYLYMLISLIVFTILKLYCLSARTLKKNKHSLKTRIKKYIKHNKTQKYEKIVNRLTTLNPNNNMITHSIEKRQKIASSFSWTLHVFENDHKPKNRTSYIF